MTQNPPKTNSYTVHSLAPEFKWKTFFLLLGLIFLGSAGVIPYLFTLVGDNIPMAPVPFALLTFFQAYITSALLAFAGMKMSSRTGLGTPILNTLFYGNENEKAALNLRKTTYYSVLIGIIAGALITGLDYLFYSWGLKIEVTGGGAIPSWQEGILASFYGGVAEEVMMRLFFMNLLVLGAYRIKKIKPTAGSHSTGIIITAIVVSSVIFAAGHLPVVAGTMDLSPLLVVRTIALSTVPGLFFGYLFYRNSFLSAVISHFVTDIVLHVIFPLLQS